MDYVASEVRAGFVETFAERIIAEDRKTIGCSGYSDFNVAARSGGAALYSLIIAPMLNRHD